MIRKIKIFFLIITIILFIFFIIKFYFSEENKNKTAKLRSNYFYELNNDLDNLPTLIDDTKNIIEYKNDYDEFKTKKIKRKFRELIENQDE